MHFGAVDYFAKVWVNGLLVVSHEGGHTPFSVDIMFVLNDDTDQIVTVMVEDDPHDLSKPRGKQDWQLKPHSIWYSRTTGIWQGVWIEQLSAIYIEKIRWTPPHMEEFSIQFEATIIHYVSEQNLSIEIMLCHKDRLLVKDTYQVLDAQTDRHIILSDPGIDDFRNELL